MASRLPPAALRLAGCGGGGRNALPGAGRSAGAVAGAALGGIGLAVVGLAVVGLGGMLSLDAVSFVVFAVAVWAATGPLAGRRPALEPGEAGQRLRAVELRLLSAPEALGVAGVVLVLAVAFATSLEGVVGVFYLRGQRRPRRGPGAASWRGLGRPRRPAQHERARRLRRRRSRRWSCPAGRCPLRRDLHRRRRSGSRSPPSTPGPPAARSNRHPSRFAPR